MPRRVVLMIVILLLAAALAGCAAPPPEPVDVTVTLTEFTIESSVTEFEVGVPYIFHIENTGTVEHEWMIMPPGETDHMLALVSADPESLAVGESQTVEYTFTGAGVFEMACHTPAHYEAGMFLQITVSN